MRALMGLGPAVLAAQLGLALLCSMAAPPPARAMTSEELAEWRRTHVPAYEFVEAYKRFTGQRQKPDRDQARHDLALFCIRMPPELVARHRAYAADQRWRPAFVALVDDAIAFAGRIRNLPPEDAVALSRALREKGGRNNEYLGEAILMMFVEARIPQAEFEWAQRKLADPTSRSVGRVILRQLADGGYPDAIADIVRRYRQGDGFDRDLRKAYYWALRGRDAGLPTEADLGALSAALPPAEAAEAERSAREREYVRP